MKGKSWTKIDELLLVKNPMTFIICAKKPHTMDEIEVLGQKPIEWRYCLGYKNLTFNIEIPSINNSKASIGILRVELSLKNKERPSIGHLRTRFVEEQIESEKVKDVEKLRIFFEYAQTYWKDIRNIDNKFAFRAIKIFAKDLNDCIRPVFTFVKQLECRSINTPKKAARFISLIRLDNDRELRNPGVWRDTHTLLSQKHGSSFDLSLTLCSLLLGFGMKAYVCIGSSSDGAHAWVLTRTQNLNNSGRNYANQRDGDWGRDQWERDYTWEFWESVTGKFMGSDTRKFNICTDLLAVYLIINISMLILIKKGIH